MKYHIDDTTTISNHFTKFFFKFEKFLKKKNATQTHEKKQKKQFEKEQKRELRRNKEKKTDE